MCARACAVCVYLQDFYEWMLEDWRLFGMIPWHYLSYATNQ